MNLILKLFLILIIFGSCSIKKSKNLDRNDQLTKFSMKQDSFDSTRVFLQLENQLLKENIEKANRIIEQQNSQLEQTNDILALLFAIIAIVLTLVSIISYFTVIKPINKQKKEIKKINKQSKAILNNIQGTINNVVEKNYSDLHDNRLSKALNSLGNPNTQNDNGIPILNEYKLIGCSESQNEILLNYLKIGRPSSTMNKHDIYLNRGVNIIFEILMNNGKVKELHEILTEHFRSPISFHISFYQSFSDKWIEILTKNINESCYERLLDILVNIHPEVEDKERHTIYLFEKIIRIVLVNNTLKVNDFVNNKSFIDELERKGILELFIKIRKSQSFIESDYSLGIKKYKDNYLLKKLDQINSVV
jgi:preprotein translocase subunit YajC